LRINSPTSQSTEIVPAKIRLLSIATGCFTAIAGSLVVGLLFSIPPIILVLGAIVQPYLSVVGKWLIGVGAVLLSLEVMVLVVVIPEGIRLLRLYHDRNFLGTLSFSIASVLLVTWCDVVLIIEARRVN
jgi:chromate transport protein ChrA